MKRIANNYCEMRCSETGCSTLNCTHTTLFFNNLHSNIEIPFLLFLKCSKEFHSFTVFPGRVNVSSDTQALYLNESVSVVYWLRSLASTETHSTVATHNFCKRKMKSQTQIVQSYPASADVYIGNLDVDKWEVYYEMYTGLLGSVYNCQCLLKVSIIKHLLGIALKRNLAQTLK